MARLFPIYEQRYIELIRHAPFEEKIDFAFKYIDSVLTLFIEYGQQPNSSRELISILKQGYKGWKKICRYEIVVHTDEEGFEYLLEEQTYPDYVLARFLNTAEGESQYYSMKHTMRKIFVYMNYRYNDTGTYEEFKG